MKGAPALVLLLLTGCSTAPIADLMDFLTPGHIEAEKTAPYGGVCLPQGLTAPPAINPAPTPPPVLPTAVAPLPWPPQAPSAPSAPPPGPLPVPPPPPG